MLVFEFGVFAVVLVCAAALSGISGCVWNPAHEFKAFGNYCFTAISDHAQLRWQQAEKLIENLTFKWKMHRTHYYNQLTQSSMPSEIIWVSHCSTRGQLKPKAFLQGSVAGVCDPGWGRLLLLLAGCISNEINSKISLQLLEQKLISTPMKV